MNNKKKNAGLRARNWTFIFYPKSELDNWCDIICELGVPWAHSPLHDKDVDDNGCLLDAHYHVVIKFSNQQSYQQMLKLTGKLRTLNPTPCNSLVGSVVHFTHSNKSDKEKYQYDQQEIKSYNGLDIEELLKPTKTEINAILKEIRAFIIENDITEFWLLCLYADKETLNWSRVINTKHTLINQFVTSYRHSRDKRKEVLQVDEIQLDPTLCLPTITTIEEYKKSRKNAELQALGTKEYQESYECQYSVQE